MLSRCGRATSCGRVGFGPGVSRPRSSDACEEVFRGGPGRGGAGCRVLGRIASAGLRAGAGGGCPGSWGGCRARGLRPGLGEGVQSPGTGRAREAVFRGGCRPRKNRCPAHETPRMGCGEAAGGGLTTNAPGAQWHSCRPYDCPFLDCLFRLPYHNPSGESVVGGLGRTGLRCLLPRFRREHSRREECFERERRRAPLKYRNDPGL